MLQLYLPELTHVYPSLKSVLRFCFVLARVWELVQWVFPVAGWSAVSLGGWTS